MPSDFVLIPSVDLAVGLNLGGLTRGDRMNAIRHSMSGLGDEIAGRLEGWELRYLEGVGGWTAHARATVAQSEIEALLHDLPVDVAPDDRLYAI